MSEATPEAGMPGTPPEPVPAPTPAPPAQEPDWKAEARKWEERSKSNKSTLDELTRKFHTLETNYGEATTKLQTYESEKERAALITAVANDKGVPASALRGSTREELEAHADTLAELIKPSAPVILNQERTPETVPPSEARQFVGQLFGKD